MARSFVYERPLDVEILSNAENTSHEFRFNTLLEIKKEVEDDPSDGETELSPEAAATISSDIYSGHDPKLRSADECNQYEKSHDAPHPKLVIKFSDLWRKSEQNVDFPKKRKRYRRQDLKNELLTMRKLRSNKKRRLESSVSSHNRITRSSLLTASGSDCSRETETTLDSSQQEQASHEKEKQEVSKPGQITRLEKNLRVICDSCGMSFKDKRQLQTHKRYYTADGDYHCTICDVRFSRKFLLSRHVKIAHSGLGNLNKYKFKCHLCSDRFDRKAILITHITHLHAKQVGVHNGSMNSNYEEVTSLSNARTGINEMETYAQVTGSPRNDVSPTKSNDQQTISDGNFDSTRDPSGLVGDWYDKDKQLMRDSSRMRQNDKWPDNQFTADNQDCDDIEADTSLTYHPIIINCSELFKTTNLEKSQENVAGGIDEVALSSRSQLMKKNRTARRLQERSERNQMQRTDQPGSEILPRSDRSKLGGDLVDHLGKKVGNWSVPEPIDQSHKSDYVSCCNGANTSDIPKLTTSNSLFMNIASIVPHSEQNIPETDKLSTKEKSIDSTEENPMARRVHPHLYKVSEGLRVPQDQRVDQQVGSVLSHRVSEDSEAARRNADTGSAAAERCILGIDSIQADDFGAKYESAYSNHEEDGLSDSSCESISLKIGTSSSNVSVADSSSFENNDVNLRTKCDNSNDIEMKDVRVLLVKVENMLKLSMRRSSPKSSPLENCSLVKTETPYCDLCQKQFATKAALVQHSRWKHNIKPVKSNRNSRPISIKKSVTTNHSSRVVTNKNGVKVKRKLAQGTSKVKKTHCYLCDEVFKNTSAVANHYLSVHIKVGVLRCCLCDANFHHIRKLRRHLCKHYNGYAKHKLIKFCAVCKKEFSFPSLKYRCPECRPVRKIKKSDSRTEPCLKAQNSIKHESAYAQADAKINIPIADHEYAKRDEKIVLPRTSKGMSKNVKCLVCNLAIFKSSRSKPNSSTARASVEYCKCRKRKNVVKPQILSQSASRGSKSKPRRRCVEKNNYPKLSVGKKQVSKYKRIDRHDQLCRKKSCAQQRLRFLQLNTKNEHFVRRHDIRGNRKVFNGHKCDVCGLNCCCRKSLKMHKTRYLTNGNNVCNICGLTFAWKHVLVTHMKTAHNPKILFYGRVRCEICNQGFYNKKFLRIHLGHFHNIKYFQCKICRIRFDTSRSLNTHRKMYSKNIKRLCGICGQSFKCKYMLEYHRAQVHYRRRLKAYKYNCDVCNCAFVDELLLHAHIGHFHNFQDHETERKAIDKNVGRAKGQLSKNIGFPVKTENACTEPNDTPSNSNIQECVDETHPNREITENVAGKPIRPHTSSEYKCGICKLNFDDPCAILNHEWKFSNEGTFTCHVCNRKFMTNSLLMDHQIKHYQRNVDCQYECHICKEDFSRVDHLKMHGLHLHGPQFTLENGPETTETHDHDISVSRKNRDGLSKKCSVDDAYDTVGLMASNEASRSGKILLFQKILNDRSSTELPRRHSEEDAYCCNFCDTNFSSASILQSHIRKHAYRAYYTNSSRYLCLICKIKFRTNDILRAHVIHCHTTDKNDVNICEAESSDGADPNQSIKSQASGNNEQTGIEEGENKEENAAENLTLRSATQNPLASFRKRHSIEQSNGTTPSKKSQFSNSTSEVNSLQGDLADPTSVMHAVEYKTGNDSDSNNRNETKLVESDYSGITSCNETNSGPEEVELFTIKVEDVKGLEKHACRICIISFHSVTQFIEHFASVHLENGAYVCTVCGQKFAAMSELKDHTLEHEGEFRHCNCCNKEFPLMKDFIRHKLSHDGQTEEKRNEYDTQLSPLCKSGSLKGSDDTSDVDDTPFTCDICDKRCRDFRSMLKHWDSCIDTNGLECNLCRDTFKSLGSFKVHKKTCHGGKQKFKTVRNRRKNVRVNVGHNIQSSPRTSIKRDNKLPGKASIDHLVNVSTTDKPESVLALSDKLAKRNRSLRLGKITVKPFATVSQKSENKAGHIHRHQENDATQPDNSQTQSTQRVKIDIPKTSQRNSSLPAIEKIIPLKMESFTSTTFRIDPHQVKVIAQVCLPDEQVSDDILCNADESSSVYHIPGEDFNDVSKQHLAPNDSGLKLQHNENEEQGLASLLQKSSNTTHNSSSNQSAAQSSIDISNTQISLTMSETGQILRSNDCTDRTPLNAFPVPATNVDNAYYLCIQNITDTSDDINNLTFTPSDSGKKSQLNDDSGKILSGLVPYSANSSLNPTYVLCVKPTSENSSECTIPTVSLNDFNLNSHATKRNTKPPQTLRPRSTSVVFNQIHTPDLQEASNHFDINTHQNAICNASIVRSHSDHSKHSRKRVVAATAGTSTSMDPSTSHRLSKKGGNITVDKSAASTKEFVLTKQVVRCTYCNLLFTEKTKLIKHMESHRTSNQCPACGVTFSNESALQQHLPEHKCSRCTQCNMTFFFSDSVVYPKGAQKYCTVCNTLLPLPNRTLNRSSKSSPRQVMKCGICMETFDTISAMTVHFKLVHSCFVCGVCETKLSTKTSLLHHMETHGAHPLRVSQCKTCSKYFVDKTDLAVHALSH